MNELEAQAEMNAESKELGGEDLSRFREIGISIAKVLMLAARR